MTINSCTTDRCTHQRRPAGGSACQGEQDVFTPGEENPMAALSQLRRRDTGNLYGNNPGRSSEIEREDFPCMAPAFVCYSCG